MRHQRVEFADRTTVADVQRRDPRGPRRVERKGELASESTGVRRAGAVRSRGCSARKPVTSAAVFVARAPSSTCPPQQSFQRPLWKDLVDLKLDPVGLLLKGK